MNTTQFNQANLDRLSQAAHDLRPAISALKALRQMVSHELSSESAECADAIITRLLSISNDFLPPKPSQAATKNRCNPAQVIRQVAAEKKLMYGSMLELRIETEAKGETQFIGIEGSAFGRIISNLIDNSVQACPNEQAQIKIQIASSNGQTKIELSDNGSGFEPKILEAVLSGKKATTKTTGNGLGLSGAIAQIKNAGGNVVIKSLQGLGSTISIIEL